ncbi:MAG: hypothetical protein R3305_08300 [Gammaproteobacteria bacterium]|nr:hypothetical protein [Gammaproteobacteria bacterium]
MTAENDRAHALSVVVWDVPPAVERARTFAIKAGVKCLEGCETAGWRVEVRDAAGQVVTDAVIGQAPLIGTAALFHTEIELTAPDDEGLFAFEVIALPRDRATAVAGVDATATQGVDGESTAAARHDEARAAFNIHTVPAPDCELTVIAIDREKQAPVAGARVVVHPYRTVTDDQGVAKLKLPKGAYRLFVSGGQFIPYRGDGEIDADLTIRAELDPDLPLSDAELWS